MSKTIYLAILAACLAGCATVSEYGHGCRDGVNGLRGQLKNVGVLLEEEDMLNNYCNQVEHRREQKKK